MSRREPGHERDPLFTALEDTLRQQQEVEESFSAPPPPSAERRRVIVQEILRRQSEERPNGERPDDFEGPESGSQGPERDSEVELQVENGATTDGHILPFPERFQRNLPIFAAAVAAMAVITVGLWLRSPSAPDGDSPLPSYAVELLGATRTERSAEAAPTGAESGPTEQISARFTTGNRLELLLRPEDRIEQLPIARFWRWQDGGWQAFASELEILDGGTVRWFGTVGLDLPLGPGHHRLAIVLRASGTEEAAPESPGARTFVLELDIDGDEAR